MGRKISELTSSVTHCRDPTNGNLSGKIVFDNGTLTSFGTTAIHIIYIADPGTIFW